MPDSGGPKKQKNSLSATVKMTSSTATRVAVALGDIAEGDLGHAHAPSDRVRRSRHRTAAPRSAWAPETGVSPSVRPSSLSNTALTGRLAIARDARWCARRSARRRSPAAGRPSPSAASVACSGRKPSSTSRLGCARGRGQRGRQAAATRRAAPRSTTRPRRVLRRSARAAGSCPASR